MAGEEPLRAYFLVMSGVGFAPIAQWIRASVFGTEGRRFESYWVYQVRVFIKNLARRAEKLMHTLIWYDKLST